ncbi:hypothetical protein NSQ59_04615 [Margalitia sp. FSL K6-0131]|uniref:hypothetical protein n=1 Tax=Margalitia sp. FSL K6-0131 TaxID=2954604 RepID=UPI0030F71C04
MLISILDMFTFYRNEIARAEYENDFSEYEDLSKEINNRLIKKIVEVINSAINDV